MRLPAVLTRQSLRLRLIAASVTVLLATLGLFAWLVLHLLDESLLVQLRTRTEQIEPLLISTIAPAMSVGDPDGLTRAIDRIAATQHLSYLVLFDRSDGVIASNGWDASKPLPAVDRPGILPSGPTIDQRVELAPDGIILGSVRYGISLDFLREAHRRLLRQAAAIGLAGMLASVSLLLGLAWAMTRELARLNAASRQLAQGNFSVRVPETSHGELGQLAHSLNSLADALEARLRDLRSNEERLALVIEGTSDGIWDWDLISNQHYYSPRYRELLGYSDEREFRIGFTEEAALHADDRDRVLEAHANHLEHRVPFNQEYRLRCRDGTYRWFRGRGQAAWDADGRARRYSGSITDIHDRHCAEEALRESEERFHHAVRGSSDGIWDWDLVRDRYHISPRMKAMIGYEDNELPNDRASFFQLMHPGDRYRVKAEIERHFAERTPFDTELRLRHKNGSLLWFRARGQAVWDDQGQVVRFSGACTDIMTQKQAQERIRELLAEKQILIDNMLVGIVFIRHGAIASCNRRAEELFAYRPGELNGKPGASLFHDEAEHQRVTADCLAAAQANQVFSRELELLRADGEVFWGLVTGRVFEPKAGDDGSIWIFLDNTDRRRAIDAMRHERDFSDTLINTMPGVFYLIDRDGRFLRWNANLQRVTGYADDDIAAMRAYQLFAPESHAAMRDATHRAIRQGESQAELELLTRNGQRLDYFMAAVRVEVDGMTHLMGIGFDISRRKQAEDEVRKLSDELEQRVRARTAELAAANKELESFSYSVSHDLSAPLRGIDGFSRMLTEDFGAEMPELGRSYLQRIRAATHRMQNLIDDLLRLSRVTRDELHRGQVDLSAMARNIIDELCASQPERQVEVLIMSGLTVDGDPTLLRIAVSNLLRNAWKFTSRHPTARIEVGVLRIDDQSVYFVKDDGAGFDMRYAGKLFSAFHRLHRSSDFEGTGIGLAIVSRILLRHGGRVWAEAQIDKGATFYFTLG